MSSPGQFNFAQLALGRTLGVDALRFERIADRGAIPLDEWIGAFARKSFPVADPKVQWREAAHDLDPHGHALSWLHADKTIIDIVVKNSKGLINVYGEDISLPKELRPEAIDTFARGLEHFASYINPIFDAVANVGRSAEGLDASQSSIALDSLKKFLDPARCDQAWDNEHFGGVMEWNHKHLKSLGIVRATNLPKAKQEMSRLATGTSRHIAHTLIRTDELWPRHDLSERQRKARYDALEQIVEQRHYGLAA